LNTISVVPGGCDPDREWECADQRSCIDARRLCDGYPDCADLSDEDTEMCPKREESYLVTNEQTKPY